MTTTPPGAQKATKDGAATLLFEHLCNAEEERGIQKTAKDTPKGLLLAILFSLRFEQLTAKYAEGHAIRKNNYR